MKYRYFVAALGEEDLFDKGLRKTKKTVLLTKTELPLRHGKID